MVGTFLFNFKDRAKVPSRRSRANDHWADTIGYVLVIFRINLAKVGHAI
jgi:hypothetical protein